jgi:AraC-like DNA-binding protein
VFYVAAISLAFFLTLILFTKRGKTQADQLLAYWLLIIGIHLILFYIALTVDPYYQPYLIIYLPFPLAHGPMLFLYTASITGLQSGLTRKWGWHFLPFLLFCILLIPFFLLPHAERLVVFSNKGRGYEWMLGLHKIMIVISGVVYVSLSLWLLRKHKQTLRDRFSKVEKINLVWLRYLIYGIGLIWVAVFYGDDVIIFSMVALFVMVLGYFGVKQVGVFTEGFFPLSADGSVVTEPDSSNEMQSVSFTPIEEKGKYLRSALSQQLVTEIHLKLKQVMTEHKLFLNPELTLAELAGKLEVHSNHLSQVINSAEGKTFYDFINTLRVDEFKRQVALPENRKYTLLALAFECGFNSKTAFYRNFRNATGQSPTDYLRKQHIEIKDI